MLLEEEDEPAVPDTPELLEAPASLADGLAVRLESGTVALEAPAEPSPDSEPEVALLGLFIPPDAESPTVPEAPALPAGATVPVAEPLAESIPDAEPEAEPFASGVEWAHAASAIAHAIGNIHCFIRSPSCE